MSEQSAIKVTPEMIEAGLRELFAYSPESGSPRGSVEDIYVAMERARARAHASVETVVSSPKHEAS